MLVFLAFILNYNSTVVISPSASFAQHPLRQKEICFIVQKFTNNT
ncbi:hypothetical protein PTHTG4_21430 [Parageobacillus thermoglucosidasius]|nr:hypothetical protein PTHTG4_21430 [Parageobacillus thermoglucosidasius]